MLLSWMYKFGARNHFSWEIYTLENLRGVFRRSASMSKGGGEEVSFVVVIRIIHVNRN